MKKTEQFYLSKINELVGWLRVQKPSAKVVWSTFTSYKEKKVPIEFRRYQRNKRILDINGKARNVWIEAGSQYWMSSTLRSHVNQNYVPRMVRITIGW